MSNILVEAFKALGDIEPIEPINEAKIKKYVSATESRGAYTNITNMKGVLFGMFNDESCDVNETGFATLDELKAALIKKPDLLEDFGFDIDEFEESEAKNAWEFFKDAIIDSYVDGDSYSNMFLMDSKGEILKDGDTDLCGEDYPIVVEGENFKKAWAKAWDSEDYDEDDYDDYDEDDLDEGKKSIKEADIDEEFKETDWWLY